MRNIGLLTVRNEVDVIDQFLDDAEKYFTDIVVMDDSTDGSYEKLAARSIVKYLAKFEDIYDPNGPRTDGHKQHLLAHIAANYGHGVWVTVLNSDAFFGDDPNKAIQKAIDTKCDLVHWSTYNFFPHATDEPVYEADKAAWLALPIQKRLTWVQNHEWYEAMQYRFDRGMNYDVAKHHRIIPHGGKTREAPIKPVLLHYPLRDPEQIVKRRADRLLTGFRNDRYFKPWIENGGFARTTHPIHPEMKKWPEMGIKTFSI